MRYRDNIEWLKSLKQQIGQTQHRDLWHFEQVIDETIENLKPLAKPHGRLIDADAFEKNLKRLVMSKEPYQRGIGKAVLLAMKCEPTVIKAEVKE